MFYQAILRAATLRSSTPTTTRSRFSARRTMYASFSRHPPCTQFDCSNIHISPQVNLLIEFCGDATQSTSGDSEPAPASSSSAAHSTTVAPPPAPPTTTHVAATTHVSSSAESSSTHVVATSSPVVPTSVAPINVGAPPSSSLEVPSSVVLSSIASAPSASASAPNRKVCKNKQRRSVDAEVEVEFTPVDPDAGPRALYDAHRRHHARMEDARRRSHL